MPDWLKDFLREQDLVSSPQNSEVEISETKLNFFPSQGKKTDETDETTQLSVLHSEFRLPLGEPQIDKTDKTPPEGVRRGEFLSKPENRLEAAEPVGSVKLPPRDELTKLTKPFSESHLAIVEGAARHRPPDVNPEPWETALRGLRAFLAAGHGDEAERLGWPKDELYAVPPVWSRVELCGAALLIGDMTVVEITPTRIRVKTASGAPQGFYRKPTFDIALAYSARIEALGDDGLKGEPRLRALEAVVNLYSSHHPGVGVDTAKEAVLAAIEGETAS